MISPIQQSTLQVKLNMRVYVKAPAPNLFLFLVEKQAMISLQMVPYYHYNFYLLFIVLIGFLYT